MLYLLPAYCKPSQLLTDLIFFAYDSKENIELVFQGSIYDVNVIYMDRTLAWSKYLKTTMRQDALGNPIEFKFIPSGLPRYATLNEILHYATKIDVSLEVDCRSARDIIDLLPQVYRKMTEKTLVMPKKKFSFWYVYSKKRNLFTRIIFTRGMQGTLQPLSLGDNIILSVDDIVTDKTNSYREFTLRTFHVREWLEETWRRVKEENQYGFMSGGMKELLGVEEGEEETEETSSREEESYEIEEVE